ncbi:hypothetical protein J3458_012722 [Metarhizium acridum]|uniref:uncharacterized protein n=1 Tax=Metarhizium acridum TaxID=92637 RepID=UPI001C6B42A0|nr:hypothetical protein J3458_012722 [Metarhizium acridum]
MAEKEKPVLYEPSLEGITTITINRPHVRNAVNRAAAADLAEAFRAFENDSSQKVCVLTGAGDSFCAGYDLHEVAAASALPPELARKHASAAEPVDRLNGAIGPMGPSRMAFTKPIIAAVSGHAVAGGLELSLLADKVVGLGRAMDMILTGRAVCADEALAFGLVNRVVAGKGEALREARRLAGALLGFPEKCMRADLVSARYSAYDAKGLEDALRFEFERGEKVILDEGVAGAKRFDGGAGRGGRFDNHDGCGHGAKSRNGSRL